MSKLYNGLIRGGVARLSDGQVIKYWLLGCCNLVREWMSRRWTCSTILTYILMSIEVSMKYSTGK